MYVVAVDPVAELRAEMRRTLLLQPSLPRRLWRWLFHGRRPTVPLWRIAGPEGGGQTVAGLTSDPTAGER